MNWKYFTALLLIFTTVSATTVTFYVDHQVQQPLDYVEISAIVKTNGESLEAAINDAAKIIVDIAAAVDSYCHTYARDKTECLDITEWSSYSIKPQYEIERKRPIFAGFVVAHEILIKVKESPSFGKLVDDILKKGVDKINSLEWKPLEEVDGEKIAVEEGIAQANQICQKIGMQLGQIVTVQQVTDFGEEEQQGEEDGEDDDEEEEEQQEEPLDINDDIVYYKFVVECHPKRK